MGPIITKQNIIQSELFNQDCLKIRYIKDTTSGNTVNNGNHWNQIQVFNELNQNVALGLSILGSNGTTFTNSVATDGIVNNSYISVNSGTKYITLDLGKPQWIQKIIIWHYFKDGRTYHNNVTEVSLDGENWYTVYEGQKQATSEGNIILLKDNIAKILKTGQIQANQFYQI